MNTESKIDATTIDEKLPREQEHLEALQRMRALDAYYIWSLNLVKPWIGKRILDAGCGIGNGTALLARSAELVLAADLSPQNVEELRGRFREQPQVRPIQLDLDADFSHLAEHQLDTIVCLDVLEHIEQDGLLLQRFYDVMQPGGHLLIKVPAVKWLYGSVDTASGHFRRYTRGELREKAQQVGWEPVSIRWMNIFGVLPYFVKSRIQKKDANLSRTFSPWQLRLIQRSMPWLRRVDRLLGPPIGQSAILVARKPGS